MEKNPVKNTGSVFQMPAFDAIAAQLPIISAIAHINQVTRFGLDFPDKVSRK